MLKSLNELRALFENNPGGNPYGQQLTATVTLTLDLTIFHAVIEHDTPTLDKDCTLEISTPTLDNPLPHCPISFGHKQDTYLTGTLNYPSDQNKPLALDDILTALSINPDAPIWECEEAN